nr:MAG: hypothetical protein KatS3mg041_0796 [Bacteroidota bacterium]
MSRYVNQGQVLPPRRTVRARPRPGRRPTAGAVLHKRSGWSGLMWFFGLLLLGAAYIWHVLRVQVLAEELAQIRREHESLQAQKALLEHEYYRLTAPSRIYEAANALGLIEDLRYRELYFEQ